MFDNIEPYCTKTNQIFISLSIKGYFRTQKMWEFLRALQNRTNPEAPGCMAALLTAPKNKLNKSNKNAPHMERIICVTELRTLSQVRGTRGTLFLAQYNTKQTRSCLPQEVRPCGRAFIYQSSDKLM